MKNTKHSNKPLSLYDIEKRINDLKMEITEELNDKNIKEKYFTFEISLNLITYEIKDNIIITEADNKFGYTKFNEIFSEIGDYEIYYIGYHYKNESELTNEIKEIMYKEAIKIVEEDKMKMLNNFEKFKKNENIQNIIRKEKLKKINNAIDRNNI